MTRPESEPLTVIITRAKVLRVFTAKDRGGNPVKDKDGNPVSVAHLNFPGASIVALGKNHNIKPGEEVDLVQTIYKYPGGRKETSSRIRKVDSPPTP